MLKKILLPIIALLLCAGLAACGGSATLSLDGTKAADNGSAAVTTEPAKESGDEAGTQAVTDSISDTTTEYATEPEAGTTKQGGEAASDPETVEIITQTTNPASEQTTQDLAEPETQEHYEPDTDEPATEIWQEPETEAQQEPETDAATTVTFIVDGGEDVGVLFSGTFELDARYSVYELLCMTGLTIDGNATYVNAINGLREKEHGTMSGWLYYINDVYVNVPCGAYYPEAGDKIYWWYQYDEGEE